MNSLAAVLVLLSAQAHAGPLQDALKADLGRDPEDKDRTCADLKSEPIKWGLVILGSEKTLAAAEKTARAISEKVGVPFSDEGYAVDPKTKKPKVRRKYEGEYSPRRSSCSPMNECITIERSSAYKRLRPGLFIIVGDVVDSGTRELFPKYKKAVPDAYIKYSEVKGDRGGYGPTSACLESDVIVLARTATYEQAVAIAQEASREAGIPYVPAAPETNSGFSSRKEPYPNITVELDSAYGEDFDSKFFLVVGGEIDPPENAKLELFARYKKIVPHAYRLKRARHMCGA